MQFSDEDLIAYLLGDAEQELAQQIQRQLAADPLLLERLSQFRLVLDQMDSLAGNFEPPVDLVDTTLARIDGMCLSAACPLESTTPAADSTPVLLSSPVDSSQRRSSLLDSTVLAMSLTVLCCLALPALVRVRFESRKAQCGRHLTITGTELINFALSDPAGRFPRVAVEGPEAFAGVYAVHLRESGSDISPEQLQCASLLGTPFGDPADTLDPAFARVIPSFAQLRHIDLEDLRQWQQVAGGDYAYNLGVAEQGSVRPPKCDGRSQFAILSDAPLLDSTVGLEPDALVAHEGKGINVFYEDGRVVFVTTASLIGPTVTESTWSDHPLANQQGVHEVGLHPHDASLAPSHFPPVSRRP